ncbi:MAG: GNAT family N-acetyltransferase [Candidatus Omnitrophica bacterium]|nr:GNAT family N-acetyltransferase [Candidatus Omnitrophota bacterium]HOX54839.1 GNAT family N-acetyltransferase [Candidatus Omnitrophota bacterium]
MTDDVIIRKFEKTDRAGLRRISCQTAFLDKPREKFIEDDEILADSLTSYFTDYEPESCFVAAQNDRVIGYITGSKNVKSMARINNFKIYPRLFFKSLLRGLFFKKNTSRFLFHLLASFGKGEFSEPDFSRDYPATLHINIDDGFRGQRIGSRLIEKYMSFLRENSIPGVHFGTTSSGAKEFFLKEGFNILFEGKRSYFRYYSGSDIIFYIFGKNINLVG